MMEDQKILTAATHTTAEGSIEKTGLKSGLMIATSFIIYFVIMKFFNIIYSPVAWGFNLLILFAGIALTYRSYRKETNLNVDYFPGLMLGCIATATGVVPFTVFVYIFLSQVDPSLLMLLKDNIFFMGEPITPLRASSATLVEGISSGVIISFMMMQYFRSGFRKKEMEKSMHG